MSTRRLPVPATLVIIAAVVPLAPGWDSPTAPPPRSVEHTVCDINNFAGHARAPDDPEPLTDIDGLVWHPNLMVTRLPLLGREVILFRWSISYVGARQPLIVQRPSLRNHLVGGTIARFYAFPPGMERGRVLDYFDPATLRQWSGFIHGHYAPLGYHLTVPRGRSAEGGDVVAVADLRDRLRARYPAEFGGDRPPKLYVAYIHRAEDRGGLFDMWTGVVGDLDPIEVPDLVAW